MSPGAELRSSDSLASPAAMVARKPRIALFLATACGLGYFPRAPGTWGSIAGTVLWIVLNWLVNRRNLAAINFERTFSFWNWNSPPNGVDILIVIVVAVVGVFASGRVSKRLEIKDPQFVVIDEISGQQLTYLFGFVVGNWKYLLLGFILFRLFDIWKPFPARQAESLPGGWEIMADDWVAGIYAALGLWIARAAGL